MKRMTTNTSKIEYFRQEWPKFYTSKPFPRETEKSDSVWTIIPKS